jgi:hypothetical protein
MVCRSLIVVALAVLASAASVTAADPPITAAEAKDYVGKRVTVCGDVVAIGHAQAKGQGGKQTFLHFDQAPPDCPFMAVIIGNDLAGGGFFFGIDKKVQGKRTCVTGYVKRQGTMPMMILDAPNQLKISDAAGQ